MRCASSQPPRRNNSNSTHSDRNNSPAAAAAADDSRDHHRGGSTAAAAASDRCAGGDDVCEGRWRAEQQAGRGGKNVDEEFRPKRRFKVSGTTFEVSYDGCMILCTAGIMVYCIIIEADLSSSMSIVERPLHEEPYIP